MIAIKDFKMPVDCSVCFGRAAIWCRFDESDRIVVPALPDESLEGRPEWCPLVDVPDINVGSCSEFPNNSDCVSRRAVLDVLDALDITDGVGISSVACDLQEEAIRSIENLPSAQPEIIRCRDCAWGMTGNFSKKFFCSLTGALAWVEPNSFCSYAERKTDGSD